VLTENQIVMAVQRHFKAMGHTVRQVRKTTEHGTDVIAERRGEVWYVEAKGETSSKKHTQRYGQPFNSAQIKSHVSRAVFTAMSVVAQAPSGRRTRAGVAFPDVAGHRAEVASIATVLERLGIEVFWVAGNRSVQRGVNGGLFVSMQLPSGKVVHVRRDRRLFERWSGTPPDLPKIWASKGFVKYGGRPLLAELAILRSFQRDGWRGVWVNNFGHRTFLTDLPGTGEPVELPTKAAHLFGRIERRNGGRAGCWDVFAWKGPRVIFAEAKRMNRDRIRPSQLRWLEAALSLGVPVSSFVVVEWDMRGRSQ